MSTSLCSGLLQQDTQLTVPILDALSSLNLSAALLSEVLYNMQICSLKCSVIALNGKKKCFDYFVKERQHKHTSLAK